MKASILASLLAFSLNGFVQAKDAAPAKSDAAKAQSADAPVKKSKTGICHAQGTTYYAKTQSFTPFKTIDDCLKSGGRLPKK